MAHQTKQSSGEGVQRTKSITSLIKKYVDDKKVVSQYVKGEVSLNEVHARGIKFVKVL